MSVYKKLMAARIKLHSMEVKKSGRNEFAKYNYMELADFLIPAQTIFNELGLCGVVSFTADMASLTITDIETDKQIVITSPMGSAALKGCHEVQNIGAVETYQRRYLWVTALEIVEHDAIDASAGLATKEVKKQGGLSGIGDDLPEDWKQYLQGVAADITALVAKGDFDGANLARHAEPLDDIQELYMERFLDSKTRSAIRNHNLKKA